MIPKYVTVTASIVRNCVIVLHQRNDTKYEHYRLMLSQCFDNI